MTLFCLGLAALCVTELLRSSVSSVTRGAIHEFGMAGAVGGLGLVKSPRVVVGAVYARERPQYRGLVLALPLPAETADRRSRRHVRQHRADAPSLRGIRLWLRISIVPSARGCSAHLPVRHLAVERRDRTVGGDRGRGLLRGAVGDCAASARH